MSVKSTTAITTVRVDRSVLQAATKRARKLGMSRTAYLEWLLRRDLGLPAAPSQEASCGIFG